MRLGILVYATATGLGQQTHALYRHLKPAKVMLVDISSLNGLPVHSDWYNFDIRTNGYPSRADIDNFLTGLDVVFICESPLNYYLYDAARRRGIRTICAPNPEFSDHLTGHRLPLPDLFALPTPWKEDEIRALGVPTQLLRVPVDRSQLPQRTITEAKTFFHVAGRPAHLDRNGTLDFIMAARQARHHAPGAQFILYCQAPTAAITQALRGSHVELVPHVDDPAELYRQGDVMVMPRKYGGLSLPMQEALGSGIPTLMTRISPNTDLLPDSWLVEVLPNPVRFKTRGWVDAYSVYVPSLAQKMVHLHREPETVQVMAKEAREMGEQLGWESMLEQYKEVIYG